MLLFMWVHYHPAQLGLSEFTLDDLTSHDGGGVFFQLTLVMRYKGDMCPTASLLHICALCVRTHTRRNTETHASISAQACHVRGIYVSLYTDCFAGMKTCSHVTVTLIMVVYGGGN